MSDGQIRAALGLLRKTMADLAVTSHTGPDGGPVLIVTGVDRDYVEPDTNPKPGFQD